MPEKVYDIFLNGKGYRLADGPAALSANIGTPLAAKVVTGDYSLADFDLYSLTAQGNFQGGIGQLMIDDTTRYLWGYRCDARGEVVTLGPKLDNTQPDSTHEAANTVGLIDVQSALNYSIANEPENQITQWLELDQVTHKVAIPFATAGSNPGGGAFEPDDLPDLVLWLKSDDGVFTDDAGTVPAATDGDIAKYWEDHSASANDYANPNSTCVWNTNQVNSLPAVKGSGGSEGFLEGLAPVTGGSTKTFFILVKTPDTSADEAMLDFGWQDGPASGEDYFLSNALHINVEDGRREFTSNPSTTDFQIITIRQNGDDISDTELWVDGVASTIDATGARTMNIGATDLSATLFARNQSSGPSRFSEDQIVEVIAYSTNLSDASREDVEAYLNARMAGSITPGTGDNDVERVWMYIRAQNAISDASTVKYSIYADDTGKPGAALTNGEIAVDVDTISYFGQWVEASFAIPPTLAGVTSYWLVLDGSGIVAGENISIMTSWHSFEAAISCQVYTDSWAVQSGWTAIMAAQYVNRHPDTSTIKFIEWLGNVYALAGKRLYRILDPLNVEVVEAASQPHKLGADGTDMLLVQRAADADPALLIALGNDTPMELWDGDTTFTALGATETADRVCLHDNLWWRASESSTAGVFVQGTLDYEDWVLAGTAGATAQVGDSRFPIRHLFSWKGQLYAAKIDGLYILTYADTYPADGAKIQANRLLSLESEINLDNFRGMAIWQEDLYFSLASGIAQFSSSNVFSSVTPDSSLLEQERKRGRYVSFIPTLTYMYALYESDIGDWSQILSYSGAWHSLATLDRTGDLGGALFVDSGLYSEIPRIWTSSLMALTSFVQPTWSSRRWTFAEDSESSAVKFFDRSPGAAPNGWMDEAEGRLYTSWIDGDLLNITKDWVDLDVVVDNIDPNQYFITVYYRFDDKAAWVELGECKETPVTTLVFPTDTATRKIQLRFDFYTNESHNSPQLLGYSLRYVPRPDTTEIVSVQIMISDELELHNKVLEPRNGAELWDDLSAARDSKEVVSFTDLFGRTFNVHVSALSLQLGVRKEESRSQTSEVYIAVVQLTEA